MEQGLAKTPDKKWRFEAMMLGADSASMLSRDTRFSHVTGGLVEAPEQRWGKRCHIFNGVADSALLSRDAGLSPNIRTEAELGFR